MQHLLIPNAEQEREEQEREEQERLSSLHRYAVLDTPPEAAFDRLAALAARLFDVPVALVSLVDKDRQWFKARQGAGCDRLGTEIRREIAFCAHTILSQDVLVVEDAHLDPRFASNPLVTGDVGLRFYAGAPLIGTDGNALGALCLLDFQPRPFSAAQQLSLQDLAASVVSELDLRRSVTAFAESEHLYRQMFEDSPQPMWVFDVETLDFLAVNDTAIAHFGYSREEFLRLKLSDLRHPDDLATMLHFVRSEGPGTRFVGLCRNFKKNGDAVWTDISSHPISFEGHNARLVVATDVTERKAAEEALRRTLSMMQAQQASDPDGILVIDENHRIVTCNPRLREIWPLPDALCVSGDDASLLRHFQPLLQGTDVWLTEQGPSLKSFQSEITVSDGRFFDCSSNPILSSTGHYYGRLWVFRDITERRLAEEALQRSFLVLKAQQEAALDGILVVDENRHITSYNQRLCDLWHTPLEIIQSGDDEKHLAYALSLLKNPEEFLQRVMHLYEHPSEHSRDEVEMRDGRTFDRYSGPILSAEGKSHGRIWSFRDVTDRKQMEEALRRSEQRLSLHLQQTPLAVIEFAQDMSVTYWNAAAEAVFGYTEAEALGQNGLLLLVPDEDRSHVERVCQDLFAQIENGRVRNHNRAKSGKIILCEWYNTPLQDDQGCVIGIASLARDITEEQHALDNLARSEARKTTILDTALDCIVSTDHTGIILEWNPAAERTFGYRRAEALGRNLNALIVPSAQRASAQQRMQQYLTTGEGLPLNRRAETTLLHRSGLEFPVEFSATAVQAGSLPIFTIYLRDITEQKRLEVEREALLTQTEILLAEALERADRDPLTGLLNHRAFHKRLKEEVGNAERTGQGLAMVLLDVNNFKFFNDVYGHLAGDDVLKRVTWALQGAGRPQDVLARFGGDEFALLMPGADHAAALHQAEELHTAAARVTYQPPGYEVAIPFSLSLGIACFPEDGTGRTDLLEAAGDRLRVAKTGGDEETQAFHLRRDLSQSVGGFTMLDALVTAVDNKDRYTRRHSEDVLEYSIEIAQTLGLDAKMQQTVKVAALLHDVGKIGVPDSVLRKPGKLTEDEYEAVKQHPLMGAIIVGAVAGFEDTLDAVRHHHERWDGHGYPFGLRGEEIPLIARLMAVADAYSAMTTDRPYRKGMEPARALHILDEGAGTQWDPVCVQTFLRVRRAAHPDGVCRRRN